MKSYLDKLDELQTSRTKSLTEKIEKAGTQTVDRTSD